MSFWDSVGAGDALRRAGLKGGHATRRLDYSSFYRNCCKRFEAGIETDVKIPRVTKTTVRNYYGSLRTFKVNPSDIF